MALAVPVVEQTRAHASSVLIETYPGHVFSTYCGDAKPVVDGDLEGDKCWNKASWHVLDQDISQQLFEKSMGESTFPRKDDLYETKVSLAWDEDYLYLAATVGEPSPFSPRVTGNNGNNGVPYADNDFEVGAVGRTKSGLLS